MERTLLDKVRAALRVTTTAYDDELGLLIESAKLDSSVSAGIVLGDNLDALLEMAIITYCRVHFGSPDDYDRLKAAYDEQKAQLMCASGYRL